jgi:hypothetical protein
MNGKITEYCKKFLISSDLLNPEDKELILKDLYCHVCGNIDIHNSTVDGYWCSECGSSDSDE